MAGMIWFNDGVHKVGDNLWNGSGFSGGWRFSLFVNNHTPVVTDTSSAYTRSSNMGYSDYSGMGLTQPSASGGVQTSPWASHTFTFSASGLSETVYGWMLEINISGTWYALGAKLLTTPYPVSNAGDSLPFTFTFTAQRLP